MGDLHAAEDWLDSRAQTALSRFQQSSTDIRKHVSKYEELLRARIFLATDRFLDAQTCLATLSQEMEQAERVDILIEIQILDALCLNAQGRLAEACAALDEALSLAKNGDYVRIFLDEGEPLVQLLNRAVSSGTNADYGRKLLRTFSEEHHEHEQLSRDASLVADIEEPLSDREIQVLHLLASPLTSAEIARELYISVNTIRFHIKNIYSKLGVHSRSEALIRGKELGLLH